MKKILIIDKMHDSIVPMLESCGFKANYSPSISREEIISILPEYHGLVVRSKTNIDQELLAFSDQLEFVARAGAGIDKLDVEELEQRNISIVNAPEGNRDALAEHAMGMLLSLMNKIYLADEEVRNWIWDRERNRGFEIMGKTVGIIGYGYMGQAFAKRLVGFGCEVLAYDKYKLDYGDDFAKKSTLDEIFDKSHVLSIHTPLTEETRGMVDDDFISKFKRDIVLMNTARGEIIPINTIVNGLDSGKIIGAALDVLENEKIAKLTDAERVQYKALFSNDKVLLTPHVAGWTYESYVKINEVLVTKIKLLYKDS